MVHTGDNKSKIKENGMKKGILMVSLLLAIGLVACGGSKTKTNTSADASAQVDIEPIDELQGLSSSLQASVDALMQPINDVDGLIDDITSLPTKLNLDAPSLMSMFSAQLSSDGTVEVSADITTDEMARAEIQGILARLKAIVDGLKAIPENTKMVAAQAATAVVRVPALATKVTTSANAKLVNPFGKAEDKAKAQADIQAVAGIQAGVQAQIQDIQAKVTEIPALAASALAKLTAAFAGGASAGK